jgi:CheY-like chemotaxis protein
MPHGSELHDALLPVFRSEAGERLAAMTAALESLGADESESRDDPIDALVRHAHSLKGGAQALKLKDVRQVCERMEAVLIRIREGDQPLSPLILRTLRDALVLLRRLVGPAVTSPRRVDEIVGQLAAVLLPSQAAAAVAGAPARSLQGQSRDRSRVSGGAAEEPSKTPTGVATRQQQATILVADDSATSRLLVAEMLRAAGYQVAVVEDGAAALRTLMEGAFDLLVSDVEMPHLSGFELTATIRREPRLKTLPVILLTALEGEDNRQRGCSAGANVYIERGNLTSEVLLSAVRDCL